MRNKIVIVGCGFLGSHFVEQVCKLLYSQDLNAIYSLRLIDFDTWDERNPANQNVTLREASQGAYKVDTLAVRAREYSVQCEAIKERLTFKNMGELLADALVVIDCVDNIPTRQMLWAAGKGGVAPTMHCGISKRGTGEVNWAAKELDTFPYTPLAMAGRTIKDDDAGPKLPPCEMYKFMHAGLRTVEASTRALAFFLGLDPWSLSPDMIRPVVELQTPDATNEQVDALVQELIDQIGPKFECQGLMTCWRTNPNDIQGRVDELTLVNGWYPTSEVFEAP